MALPHPCLVADVGGTHARFALVRAAGEPLSSVRVLKTGSAPVATLVRQAMAELGEPSVRSLIVAAAGPVHGRSITLTNGSENGAPVMLDGPSLADELKLEQGLLLNDFEGLCLALPFLGEHQLLPISGAGGDLLGARVVVGPGTGLGVGALLPVNGKFLPVRSEGGHVGFAPHTAAEQGLWPQLKRLRDHDKQIPAGDVSPPLSAEDVLSGRGLSLLYRGLCGLPAPLAAAQIIEAALAQSDANAVEAVQLFLALLGRFASDPALNFCATGGVYLGGGILPRIEALVQQSRLPASFAGHGDQPGLLQTMPVAMIRDPMAALTGLAKLAAAPDLFMLDYASRFWRA